MDKYIVYSEGGEVEVYADNLSFGAGGLIFQRNKENIAQFMKWDYWMKFDKEKREQEKPKTNNPEIDSLKQMLHELKKLHGLCQNG